MSGWNQPRHSFGVTRSHKLAALVPRTLHHHHHLFSIGNESVRLQQTTEVRSLSLPSVSRLFVSTLSDFLMVNRTSKGISLSSTGAAAAATSDDSMCVTAYRANHKHRKKQHTYYLRLALFGVVLQLHIIVRFLGLALALATALPARTQTAQQQNQNGNRHNPTNNDLDNIQKIPFTSLLQSHLQSPRAGTRTQD